MTKAIGSIATALGQSFRLTALQQLSPRMRLKSLSSKQGFGGNVEVKTENMAVVS
jgi:hypothetical protein